MIIENHPLKFYKTTPKTMDENIEEHNLKRHIKDTEKFFRDHHPSVTDPKILFLFKKTEKLSAAIYLLTDLYVPEESLKWRLRSSSLSVLSFIISSTNQRAHGSHTLRNTGIAQLVGELISFLELALYARLISPMNFSILRDEYISLCANTIENLYTYSPDKDLFPEQFFTVQSTPISGKPKSAKGHRKGHYKRQPDPDKGHSHVSFTRDREQELPHVKKDNQVEAPTSSYYLSERAQRNDVILQVLRTKGEVGIKDISSIIINCSEKTIQRELIALIERGLVIRKGERRWSTYVLKDSDNNTEENSGLI